MTANKVPRYLLFVLTLGSAMAIIMLSMFYAQYRWLTNEITGISVSEHGELLQDSFERRARAQAHAIADDIALSTDPADAVAVIGMEIWGGTESNPISFRLDNFGIVD